MAQVYERGNRLLVTSVESFLAGTYENYLLANNQIVPVWAADRTAWRMGTSVPYVRWRKTLIRSISLSLAWDPEAWMAARSTLALDLVRLVQGRAAVLAQVQRRLLIPIESVLMEDNDVTAPELVIVTKAALRCVRE